MYLLNNKAKPVGVWLASGFHKPGESYPLLRAIIDFVFMGRRAFILNLSLKK